MIIIMNFIIFDKNLITETCKKVLIELLSLDLQKLSLQQVNLSVQRTTFLRNIFVSFQPANYIYSPNVRNAFSWITIIIKQPI